MVDYVNPILRGNPCPTASCISVKNEKTSFVRNNNNPKVSKWLRTSMTSVAIDKIQHGRHPYSHRKYCLVLHLKTNPAFFISSIL